MKRIVGFLNNLKMKQKLLLVMFLPITTLILTGSFIVFKEYNKYSQTTKLEQLVLLSPLLTNVVHELQKERGLSAGLIGSGGKPEFVEKLTNQHLLSNKAVAHLQTAIKKFDMNAYNKNFSLRIDATLSGLIKLQTIRKKIRKQELSVEKMAKYYTGTVSDALGVVSQMALLTDDAVILKKIVGFTSFLQAKEYAGLERAMGANGFGKGKFSAKVHLKFVSFSAQQKAILAVFKLFATPKQLASFQREMQSSDVKEVARLIGIAKNSVYDKNYKNSTVGTYWFAKSTLKINRLKSIEDLLAEDLLTETRALASLSGTMLASVLIIMLVTLLLTLISSVMICTNIGRPIKKISEQMNLLASGNLAIDLEVCERTDEIGEMAESVQVFKQNALMAKQLEKEQIEQKKISEFEKQKAQEKAIDSERKVVVDVIGKAMQFLSKKDLGYRITDDLPEAYLPLKLDFNNAIEELSTTINKIEMASQQILSGSREIHTTGQELARRSEIQAATVEETAAALEETTTAVNLTATSAKDVGTLTDKTKVNAEHSGEIVKDAIVAMNKIEASSKEISNIIGMIDDIAFQTNLLALNAGVEAARAGESGRGFAVVAQEVRELAQRSADAAKEISKLIVISGNEVENGAKLVNGAGDALRAIVEEVKEVSKHVSGIVDATSEQSLGIEQINKSIISIDQNTQENAAMADESTAASASLNNQVTVIDGMLKEFKTGQVITTGRPKPVTKTSTPQVSPARALSEKVANFFAGTAVAGKENSWENF